MPGNYIITGTDTDVGKTVFAAALMQALSATDRGVHYWKPVQAGLDGAVDTRTVQRLSGLGKACFLPENYVLSEALSPHRAAEIDDVEIDVDTLVVPEVEGSLIIEGAGGLMVPLTRGKLLINQMKKWDAPVIVVARTRLGTINHTLLTLEALWARDIPVHGIAFVGDENADNMKTIADISGERVLGRLPMIDDLTSETLAKAFAAGFAVRDF